MSLVLESAAPVSGANFCSEILTIMTLRVLEDISANLTVFIILLKNSFASCERVDPVKKCVSLKKL